MGVANSEIQANLSLTGELNHPFSVHMEKVVTDELVFSVQVDEQKLTPVREEGEKLLSRIAQDQVVGVEGWSEDKNDQVIRPEGWSENLELKDILS